MLSFDFVFSLTVYVEAAPFKGVAAALEGTAVVEEGDEEVVEVGELEEEEVEDKEVEDKEVEGK